MTSKIIVHIGPTKSQGGISQVVRNIIRLDLENYSMREINTHSEGGLTSKFSRMVGGIVKLLKHIHNSEIDLAHIHVTHGVSWWRKVIFMRICAAKKIETIVHIHSGKFDEFSVGLPLKSVRKNTRRPGTTTILLEERWREGLSGVVPDNCIVAPNFSFSGKKRSFRPPKGRIEIILLSRGTKVKQVDFALDIMRKIRSIGSEAFLTITGRQIEIPDDLEDCVKSTGWISESEKMSYLEKSDFLISPSKYEGCSVSVIEAINSRLPVLVSEASRETIGIEELVIDQFDPSEWAKKLVRYSEEEKYSDILTKLENITKYSPEKAKEKWSKIYADCVER